MSEPLLSRLEIAAGNLSAQRAMVAVSVPGCSPADGWSLSGQITGPFSKFHTTLTASFVLRDLGPGPMVLARAHILEPIYWTPETPACYQLDLELSRDGQVVEQAHEIYSLRWLETRDGYFEWQRHRIVLRGCVREPSEFPQIADRDDPWREANLTFCVENPELLTGAAGGTFGYCTLQKWSPELGSLPEVLAKWSRFPSVLAVLVDADHQVDHRELPQRRSIFLAADLRQQAKPDLPDWADVLAINDRQLANVDSTLVKGRPILVFADRRCEDSPQAIRDACDKLRAELAPIRQCAGYFVIVSQWLVHNLVEK